MAHILGCENIHLEFPTKVVFDSVTLGISDGDRIGVVGANGDGKSTLLAVLSGEVLPDRGNVVLRSGTTIGRLMQSDDLDDNWTVGYAVVGDRPEHDWASDPQTRSIIRGLMADLPWDSAVGDLSGGQRRRVDLARVLIHDYDVLMLDEPTNHLDVQAIAWLAGHLQARWPRRSGALMVVSHDRWFLDEVCLTMWDVHDRRVDQYEGGYSAYILQRVERAQMAQSSERKRQNALRRELAWLARGPRARSTKPKFRVEAARELIADEPPTRNTTELKRTAMSRLGKQVVDIEGVTVVLGDKKIIDDLTWHIGPGDRIGLLGANGSGKTTLLRTMTGELAPTSGRVGIGKTVRFAVLSQELGDLADLMDSAVHEVLRQYKTNYTIGDRSFSPSQLLEQLGFDSAHLSARVRELSGGQRRRLQLMLILLEQPNVLILDEPDNDMDVDMLGSIENVLDSWPGTLLLITHDRQLMERVTDDQYAVVDGQVLHVPGGIDEYIKLMDSRTRRQGAQGGAETSPGTVVEEAPAETKSDHPKDLSHAEAHRLRKELASLERKIDTASKRLDAALSALESVDTSDFEALIAAQERIRVLEAESARLEESWLLVSERLG